MSYYYSSKILDYFLYAKKRLGILYSFFIIVCIESVFIYGNYYNLHFSQNIS
ncbi:hypothetical protein EMIT079MI2_140135 [Bacillus sp. IT-79MI2]